MLVPYYRKMSPEEMNIFKEQEENLISLGFEFIFHPTTMEITSAPMVLSDIDLDEFVFSVLDNQGEIKYLRDLRKIKEKFARMACRSAIKGGMRLSEEEISYIMDYFLKNGMPLQCPHGRPTMVVFNKNEVEKWFKRIV